MSVAADPRGAAAGDPEHHVNCALASILGELRELRAAVEALSPLSRPDRLVDAATVGAALGVSSRWVYAHADELGGVRLGDGAKPRIRFDIEVACEQMACWSSKRSQGNSANGGGRVSTLSHHRAVRLPVGVPKPGSILAVRPRERAPKPKELLRSESDRRTTRRPDPLDSRRARA